MRLARWIVAAACPCVAYVVGTAGCSGNCSSAYDHSLTVDVSTLSSRGPLCSTCGGPVQSPYYECLSTCPPPEDAGAEEAGVAVAEDGGPSTTGSLSCVVDGCPQSVQGNGSCDSVCATLYPGENVTSCSSAGSSVTCNFHEPGVCH